MTGLPAVSLAGAPAASRTGTSDGGPVEPVAGSGHGVGGAVVNADLLAAVAAACRDRRRLRLRYQGRDGTSQREVEPHRLVHTPRRWYLLAWDLGKDDWRTFRVDRIEGPLGPPGARFTPRPLPQEDHEDAAAYVARSITSAPYRYRARVLFHAPLEAVAPRTSPGAGRLEAVDGRTCQFSAGADSLDELAVHVAVKGFDFEVLEPPELVPVLREVAARLRRAADRDTPADGLGNVRRPSREPRPPK
ncbi:helix-turn-helix transcriptional regulator [Nonomuraea sp. NPDC004297]